MPESATIDATPETAAATDALLEALDFTPTSQQCECEGCPGHGRGQCIRTAEFCVRVHAIGNCNDPEYADTGGYAVQFVCQPCMIARAARIAELFDKSHILKRMQGGYLQCVPCGRDLIKVSDFWESRAI